MSVSLSPPATGARPIPQVRLPLFASGNTLIARLTTAFPERGDVVELTGVPLKVFCLRHPEHLKKIYAYEKTAISKHPRLLPRVNWVMRTGTFVHPGGDDWKRKRQLTAPL
ncbi:MAG TPA: hypothetical protein VFW33_13955, partial [Gemmataceae bacterium]|nr:hypothetical protein [Gemmataceae bacterium]